MALREGRKDTGQTGNSLRKGGYWGTETTRKEELKIEVETLELLKTDWPKGSLSPQGSLPDPGHSS